MGRFNKIITAAAILCGLLILTANLLLTYTMNDSGNRYYMVEVNRAYNDISENGFREDMDLSGYQYITDVSYLPADAGSGEIQRFYDPGNDSVIIRPLGGEDITGYVKFAYTYDPKAGYIGITAVLNICLGIMGASVIAILFYIKRQVIAPFNEVREMPYALSKGHLTQSLKENKNRFFGRFIWGLDLLRENLEEHKANELALAKDKKTMVLSISHDIKTPLAAINLYTRALSENLYEDEEKRRDIVRRIEEKANEIEGFVQDIINTSTEDFLHIEVKNSAFYLNDLVERLERYYSDKLEYLKCEFTIEPFDNCLIYGDIERSLEMFENIMENAIKYGDGKSIAISFDREEDCRLITVTNTGNTLPADELVHIWDSFWRGSNVKDKKGSGLGLYICRQIVTQMKGDIFAAAENGLMRVTAVLKIEN